MLPLAPKGFKKRLHSDLRAIFDATDLETALLRLSETVRHWEAIRPEVASRLEEETEECLSCFHFPPSHRKQIRTTNCPERFNQEIRRRTHVVRIFPNEGSALRLITALAVEQSEDWETGSRYLDLDKLEDWVMDKNMQFPWLTGARSWLFENDEEPTRV